MVEQTDAAVLAEVIFRIFQVDGALATGTDALGEPAEGGIVAELITASLVRLLLRIALACEISIHGLDQVAPDTIPTMTWT